MSQSFSLTIAPVLSHLAPTFVFQISDEWIHFQAALVSDHAQNFTPTTSSIDYSTGS